MGKYFGTDGFRGEANVNLTAEHAYKIGRFLGWYYGELKKQKQLDEPAKIVIGKDTRMPQAALLIMWQDITAIWVISFHSECIPLRE